MKKNEKVSLNELFRSRLEGAEMPLREGGWEALQQDLSALPEQHHGAVGLSWGAWPLRRVAAAASVALLLCGASASFWWLAPRQEEPAPASRPMTVAGAACLDGDGVLNDEFMPRAESARPAVRKAQLASLLPAGGNGDMEAEEAEGVLSLRLSIVVSGQTGGGPSFYRSVNRPRSIARYVLTEKDVWQAAAYVDADTEAELPRQTRTSRRWALKGGVGTALPKGSCHAPLQARVTWERYLNERLSLEAGLQYSLLSQSDGPTLHTLALPVRLNCLLAAAGSTELYASAGGAVEKCVAGAADNGFGAEPLQWSAMVGVGVRQRLNDRLALFAEPTVTHHFSRSHHARSLYDERPTNLALLCGVRMCY